MSRFRLPLIVIACGLFWTLLGAVLGGLFRHPLGGAICGLLFGLVYVSLGSGASEKFPLDVWDAKLLDNAFAPNTYEMLRELCPRMDMELPTLYHVPEPRPNAFTVAGRDGNTAIVVTNGLTRVLEKDEVQAVLALMMARLATGAIPAWTVGTTLAGLPLHLGQTLRGRKGLAWLGDGLLAAFAFPAAGLLRLTWSEAAVTAADGHAAHLAERPGALESALLKMEAAWAEQPGGLATSLLFAVPVSGGIHAAFWERVVAAAPGPHPNATERCARFLGASAPAPAETA